MLITERIKAKWSKELHDLCHASKDLYNRANYLIRQNYTYLGDENDYQFVNYDLLYFQIKNDATYKGLPASSSQQTLIVLEKNWASFFESMKEWKANPSKFLGMPRPPKYKDKNGEFVVIFAGEKIHKGRTRNGYIYFPKMTKLQPIKTRIEHFREVRVVPRGLSYIIEIVYEKLETDLYLNEKNIMGIDLGLNNLVTCTNNIGLQPFVVRGGVVKSINQFYNKEKTRLQSIKDQQRYKFETRKMQRLTQKRYWKIEDYLHKTSRYIVNYCIENDIGIIAIGYNDEWKQYSNLGKKNNQAFISIPFLDLVNKIEYKAKLVSINVVFHEESFTSKASFLDLDAFTMEGCTGKRLRTIMENGLKQKCNLYKRNNGIKIHGDVNGSYNIARKAVPEAFAEGIEGLALVPRSVVVDTALLRNQTKLTTFMEN